MTKKSTQKILIIDNYDSYTYNLYGAIMDSEYTAETYVLRNNEISETELMEFIESKKINGIVISPGPGSPDRTKYFGLSKTAIVDIGGREENPIPVFGVCLGMQGIGYLFGARISKAKTAMHGKESVVKITDQKNPLFRELPNSIKVMRYHSLALKSTNSAEIVVSAISQDTDEIMALRHKTQPIFGVQFHPESFATQFGKKIIDNFLSYTGGSD